MPSLTPEERERQRPERNMEIIKPRAHPRARIEITRGAEVSEPPVLSMPEPPAESADETLSTVTEEQVPRVYRTETLDDGTEQVYVKRRRYRRRISSRGSAIDRGGFLARIFGKK